MSDKIAKKILVVDDDHAICQFLFEVLAPLGYKVLQANNGEEAMKFADALNDKIDLLLTDLILPEMNGYELFKAIQALHPKIKILLMSGYSEHELAKYSIPSDTISYIKKPFTPAVLTTAVQEALGG